MAKSQIIFWCLLLLSACVQPDNDRNEQPAPTVITNTIIQVDTVWMEIPCPEKSLVDKFTDIAKSYTGLQETTGNNDGPEIKAFLNTCNLGEGNPWCAAYIAYILDSLEQEYPELCAWSPAYFYEPQRIVWERGNTELIPKGSVFGLYYKSKGRVAHVGIIYKDTGRGYVVTLEGNTNAGGSRDGNMAAIRMRRKSQIFVAANWLNGS